MCVYPYIQIIYMGTDGTMCASKRVARVSISYNDIRNTLPPGRQLKEQLLSVHWTKGNYLPPRYSIMHIIVCVYVQRDRQKVHIVTNSQSELAVPFGGTHCRFTLFDSYEQLCVSRGYIQEFSNISKIIMIDTTSMPFTFA